MKNNLNEEEITIKGTSKLTFNNSSLVIYKIIIIINKYLFIPNYLLIHHII